MAILSKALMRAVAGASKSVTKSTVPYLAPYALPKRLDPTGTTIAQNYTAPSTTYRLQSAWATGAGWVTFTYGDTAQLVIASVSPTAVTTQQQITMTTRAGNNRNLLQIAPNNAAIAVVSSGGNIWTYKSDPDTGIVANPSPVGNTYAFGTDNRALSWSPESDALYVGGNSGTYSQFFLVSPTGALTSATVAGPIPPGAQCSAWAPSSTLFVGVGTSVYPATRSGSTLTFTGASVATGSSSGIDALVVSPDGAMLAASSVGGQQAGLVIFTISGSTITKLTEKYIGSNTVDGVAWSPDGTSCYVLGQSIFNSATGNYSPALVRFSRSGSTFDTGSGTNIFLPTGTAVDSGTYGNGLSVAP